MYVCTVHSVNVRMYVRTVLMYVCTVHSVNVRTVHSVNVRMYSAQC